MAPPASWRRRGGGREFTVAGPVETMALADALLEEILEALGLEQVR